MTFSVTASASAFCLGAAAVYLIPLKTRARRAAAVLCGVSFAAARQKFGFGTDCAALWALYWLLTAAALYDAKTMEIPRGIFAAAPFPFLAFLPCAARPWHAFLCGILGASTLGGGLFLLSRTLEAAVGQKTLGGGDIKLFAAIGLYLGVFKGALAASISCFAGILYCRALRIRDGVPFPFAPSIAFGAFAASIFGDEILRAAAFFI